MAGAGRDTRSASCATRSGKRLLTRKILKGIAPLRFGEGHDCTFAYALAVATKTEYDWVMGCSGAAFVTRIDTERWDPIAASPHDPATFARGARAVGVRLDPVVPPYDDEMRELVLARVAESIDAGSPPLVRGLEGPPEIGLLIGYDTDDDPTREWRQRWRDAKGRA